MLKALKFRNRRSAGPHTTPPRPALCRRRWRCRVLADPRRDGSGHLRMVVPRSKVERRAVMMFRIGNSPPRTTNISSRLVPISRRTFHLVEARYRDATGHVVSYIYVDMDAALARAGRRVPKKMQHFQSDSVAGRKARRSAVGVRSGLRSLSGHGRVCGSRVTLHRTVENAMSFCAGPAVFVAILPGDWLRVGLVPGQAAVNELAMSPDVDTTNSPWRRIGREGRA